MMNVRAVLASGVAALAIGTVAHATDTAPALSVRELTIRADVVVEAVPADRRTVDLPTSFVVMDVLKADVDAVPVDLVLDLGDAYRYPGPRSLERQTGRRHSPVARTVLFLDRIEHDDRPDTYRPIRTGMRVLTRSGDMLLPRRIVRDAPMDFVPVTPRRTPEPDVREIKPTWPDLIDSIRNDVAVLEEIDALNENEDPAQRNQDLMDWINDHAEEFGGGEYAGAEVGWGSLERQLFQWILDNGIPADSWEALIRARELNTWPYRISHAFCSPEGRLILLDKVLDEELDRTRRLVAFRPLAHPAAFWTDDPQYRGTAIATPEEQAFAIEALRPILAYEDPHFRRYAVEAIHAASVPQQPEQADQLNRSALSDFRTLRRLEDETSIILALDRAILRMRRGVDADVNSRRSPARFR